MPPDTLPPDTLLERNLVFLAQHEPASLAVVEGLQPRIRPIMAGEQVIDMDLGAGRFYGDNGRVAARAQLQAYLAGPDRLIFPDPTHINFTRRSLPVHSAVTAACSGAGITFEPAPVADVALAFVFGLGLGFHVEMLAAALPQVRHLVVIEPEPQFFLQAMTALDWSALHGALDGQGRRLSLLTGAPDDLVRRVERLLEQEDRVFIDGSYFFVHHRAAGMDELAQRVRELAAAAAHSGGFLEDERLMMINSLANLTGVPFHLMPPHDRTPQPAPLFIVGAGPSLDEAIPVIRHWRGHAVVMSCGSTLGILLKHGITPDIHCEIENAPVVYDAMMTASGEHDPADIRLLCSTTVDPRICRRFARRWLYFRQGPSPARLVGGDCHPLLGAEPNVANVAFSAAAYLGFRDVYLFGIDLGRRAESPHHARDSLYHGPLADYYRRVEAPFDMEVPGNFGGTVLTHWKLLQTRQALNQLQRTARFNLFNCSDGAALDDARPLDPNAVDLAGGPIQHAALLARLDAKMPAFAAGAFLADIELGDIAATAEALRGILPGTLAQLRDCAGGFAECHHVLGTAMAALGPSGERLMCLAGGSLRSLFGAEAYYGVRIADPAARHRVLQATLAALEPAYDRLLIDTVALVRECEALLVRSP